MDKAVVRMDEESALVKEILFGQLGAYDSIMGRYKNRIYAIVLRMVGDSAEAGKIVEDTFIEIYKRLPEYKETELFPDWFYRHSILFVTKQMKHTIGFLPEDYIHFYNPRYSLIEEAIVSLESKNRFEFLLALVLGVRYEKLALILEEKHSDVEDRFQDSVYQIREKLIEWKREDATEICLTKKELTIYFDQNLSEIEKEQVEEHLEFCPSCRNVVASLQREKNEIKDVLYTPRLDDDINKRVLSKLTPFMKKVPEHRSWKYQIGATMTVAAILVLSIIILPNLMPLVNKVSAYIQYGTIYNVWTEGTYKVTDNEITFEVKGVDIDPLHMVVYYDVNNETSIKTMRYGEDFNYYEPEVIQLLDEEGNQYPVEVAQPLSDTFHHPNSNKELLKEELENKSLILRAINPEELPDKFTIQFRFQRIQGYDGLWEIEVPIQYDKIDGEIKEIELDETIVVDSKIEIEFLSMIYGKHGSRLIYEVRLKEEEKMRVETLLEETKSKYGDEYQHQIQSLHASIQVVNQNNQYMLPIYYNTYYMNYGLEITFDKPIQLDFLRYYYDMDNFELKGKEEEVGQYFAELIGVQYNEPAFFSLSIPLEETKEKPLNIDIDGYKLKNLSVVKGSNESAKYEIILTAEKNSDEKQKHYNWNFVGENEEYLDVYYMNHYDPYLDSNLNNNEFDIIHVEVPPHTARGLEKITLQADGAYNTYMFEEDERQRIPLFKN